MKIKISHPEAKEPLGPRYWRSLDDLAENVEFKQWLYREFPRGAAELEEGVDRRHFLKIMAASFALAGFGLSGCRREERKILPYNKQPEQVIPGRSLYYASSMPGVWEHEPLVIETHEARPTKIEGNPSYLPHGGSTSLFAQASVLGLYDPERFSPGRKDGQPLSMDQGRDLLASLAQKAQSTQGEGMALLFEPSSSPTRERLLAELKTAYPQLRLVEHSALDYSKPEKAAKKLFGQRLRPYYRLDKVERVLAIESDFLSTEPGHLAYTRAFAKTRKVSDPAAAQHMSRLYVAESALTLTGTMADHRLRLSASHAYAFAAQVAYALLSLSGASPALLASLKKQGQALKVDAEWITQCVQDLYEQRGKALVIAGSDLPEPIHWLVALMNAALEAPGATLDYLAVADAPYEGLSDLAQAIKGKKVQTLLILEGNPAYTDSGTVGFHELQAQVPQVVRLGIENDETSALAGCYLPQLHYLESWGDGRCWDGTLLPVQPMIEPLFEGFDLLEVLSRLLDNTQSTPYEEVRKTFALLASKDEAAFSSFLTKGLQEASAYKAVVPSLDTALALKLLEGQPLKTPAFSHNALELRFAPSLSVLDGRYSNNGWLQECPEPITKLTWDNAILISPELAQHYGLLAKPSVMSELGQLAADANTFKNGHQEARIGRVTVGAVSIEAPLYIQPGLADYTLVLPLGYGRKQVGSIGTAAGFDFYPLRTEPGLVCTAAATLEVLDKTYPLANTQEHGALEGRDIIREAHRDDYLAHPEFAQAMGMEAHSPPIYGKDRAMAPETKAALVPQGASLYKSPGFSSPQQWGMVIDLNSCTGCNACVVACQAENNIPIIGKEQVRRGREMHWIRMDRYYSSAFDATGHPEKTRVPQDPQVVFQPMFCMHCELAPCENVCPVNATVHDEQGLNVMAYNRCVGTRYCANNCPVKVRRFNFFNFNKRHIGHFYEGPLGPAGKPEIEKMQKNPNVTVRMRGVMEKCTLCVQRIEEGKIRQLRIAKDSSNTAVPDGVIKTACQQVCPAEAIVFGDIADPKTRVSALKRSPLNYSVLGYLGIRPRVTYLARIRNPNPRMPDYTQMPLSRLEYEVRYGHKEKEVEV